MGFFNGLKRALGYGDEGYDDEDGMDEYNPSQRTPYINPFKKEEPVDDLSSLAPQEPTPVAVVNAAPKAVAEVEEKLPDGVFDGIITIINGNLPEFVRDCIDLEKERKAVYVAMGPQFRDYVRNLRRTSLEEARQEWVEERNRLMTKLTQSEARAEEAVKKATEIKERLMSEERQRRAIVERSHDLEARVADLEAQHEQEQLQNKSLLNKMKVMQVQAGDSQKDAEEIDRLNKVVNEQRQQLVGMNDMEVRLAELNTENENLKAEVAELRDKGGAAAVEEEFNGKMDVANALMNELRSTAAQKEREIAELTEKLKASADEITALQAELDAAKEELSIADEVQEKIEQFEVFKTKKVAEIADLKRQLAEAKSAESAESASDEQIEELKSKLMTSEQSNVALQAGLAELEGRVAELQETNRAHDVDLSNRIDDLKQQLNVAGAKLAEKESELERITADNGGSEKELKRLKAENMALDVQVKNLKANINDRDVEIAELKKSLEGNGIELPKDSVATSVMSAPVATASEANTSAFVSAIDDIDDIDWLMPSPPSEPEPEPEPAKAEKPKPAPEIGESQMSLF